MKANISRIKKKGFTILEMLIVLTVVAIILPTVFAMVFVILRQQVRIYRVTEARRQGDYILSFIKDKLIRTREIDNNPVAPTLPTPYCNSSGSSHNDASNGNSISFLDQNDVRYQIYQSTSQPVTTNLIYSSGGLSTTLNTANIAITNFNADCFRRGSYSSPLISISYDITFIDNTPTAQEGLVSFHYQTKIKLRE